MLVSPPETAGASRLATRARLLAAGLLVGLLLAFLPVPAEASASAKTATAKKALKKRSQITAPKPGAAVKGTISAKRCSIRFPGTVTSRRVTVTGPLNVKQPKTRKGKTRKPKTRKLKTKRSGKRTVRCTWKTKSTADGRYRFTVSAKVRYRGRSHRVTIKRAVTVRNRAISLGANTGTPQLGAGNTRFVGRLESQWDSWILGASPTRQAWLRQHMWGVVGFAPFFDAHTAWSPPAIAYKDLYAIYRGDQATLTRHPDWVLKDGGGNRMSIPWGCDPGPCPQYAGDIGNPEFRSAWIADARKTLRGGYSGLWIDDANMEMRVANAAGVEQAPIDPRTGAPMTFADWRRYMAEFLEQIRRELPDAQLVANVLWFGGTSIGRDSDPYIQRAYTAVDRLNLERGFNDDGLTDGAAPRDIWSVDAFMAFIDRMHERGVPVTLDSAGYGEDAWEYNLAGYFLVDQGADALNELRLRPGGWWAGWDVKLGRPLGARTRGSDGVYRREFQAGLAVLNPPRSAAKTVRLPTAMKRIDGSVVTSITLPPGRGAVLLAR